MAEQPPDQGLILQANSFISQNRWDEALRIYEQMVAQNPTEVLYYQQIAQMADRIGDIPRAVNAYLRWAQLCDSRGQFDDALKLYNQVLSMDNLERRTTKPTTPPEKIREHSLHRRHPRNRPCLLRYDRNLFPERAWFLNNIYSVNRGAS